MPHTVIVLPAWAKESSGPDTSARSRSGYCSNTPKALGAVIHRSERQRTEAATSQLDEAASRTDHVSPLPSESRSNSIRWPTSSTQEMTEL